MGESEKDLGGKIRRTNHLDDGLNGGRDGEGEGFA